MEHGTGDGGCKGKCSSTHPTMCDSSINTGKCVNVGKGVKCPNGYHVKGTKKDTSGEVQETVSQPKNKSDQIPQQKSQTDNTQKDGPNDFLGSGIEDQFQKFKEEMRNLFQEEVKLMRQQIPPQPQVMPQPQPSQTVDLATVIKLMADRR